MKSIWRVLVVWPTTYPDPMPTRPRLDPTWTPTHMARQTSSISESTDRANIDAMLDAGHTNAEIAAATNFHLSTVARYARKYRAEKAGPPPAPAAKPVPAPAAQPIAKERHLEILDNTQVLPEVDPALPVRPDNSDLGIDEPDADEVANADPHLHRLRMVNILIASGRSHRDMAKAFGRSVRTIERWTKQARETKAAAIAKIDGVRHIGDALWGVLFARSQIIINASRCLEKGDLHGHLRAMDSLTRNEIARVALIEKFEALGGGRAAAGGGAYADTLKAFAREVMERTNANKDTSS